MLKNYQIDYVTLNAFDIDDEKFMKVVKMFKEGKQESEEKINEMFENTSKGFLYKETIYRVKKND